MNTQKGLITRFGEWWDEQRARRPQVTPTHPSPRLAGWLPSRGNVLFTLVMIACQIAAVGDQQFAPHRGPFCWRQSSCWPPLSDAFRITFLKVTDLSLLSL